MVRVIMGVKGTGKTKQMIELINSAVHSENGNVVCIERGPKLTYDIHYKIRLVEASQYDMSSYDFLKGFIHYPHLHRQPDQDCGLRGHRPRGGGVPGLAEQLLREEQHQVHRHHQRRRLPGDRGHQEVFLSL